MEARQLSTDNADVIVIGGGIVGSATAYNLAKRNVRVVLLEKGRAGHEQSSRNMGAVRKQGRDSVETPLMVEGLRIWEQLSEELEEDIEWIQGGNLALASSEEEMARFEEAGRISKSFGVDSRVLSSQQVKELIPRMESTWVGGLFNPTDGHADPPKSSQAFVRAARRKGAVVEEYCAAEGFELSNNRIQGVITEKGVIRADTVICAAGAHSYRLAKMLGLDLPIRVVRSSAAETTPLPPLTGAVVWGDGFVIRQTRSGSMHLNFHSSRAGEYDITLDSLRHARLFLPIFLSNRTLLRLHFGKPFFADLLRRLPGSAARRHPFAHTVDVEPLANSRTIQRSQQTFLKHFPSLEGVEIQRTWAGNIDCTPDLLPVLGPVFGLEGFYFATGFSGHGFAMGPLMGRLLTEWVLDGKPSFDLHPMRFSRFAEGDLRIPKNLI